MQEANGDNKRNMQNTFGQSKQLGMLSAPMKPGMNGACESYAEGALYLVGVFLAGAGTGAGAPVSLRLSLSRIPTATSSTCDTRIGLRVCAGST